MKVSPRYYYCVELDFRVCKLRDVTTFPGIEYYLVSQYRIHRFCYHSDETFITSRHLRLLVTFYNIVFTLSLFTVAIFRLFGRVVHIIVLSSVICVIRAVVPAFISS